MRESKGRTRPAGEMKVSNSFCRPIPGRGRRGPSAAGRLRRESLSASVVWRAAAPG